MDRAAGWYGRRGPGAGAHFIDELAEMLATIEENPHRFQRVSPRLRRALMRNYPYALLFEVSDKEIVIARCVHQRMNPQRWSGR